LEIIDRLNIYPNIFTDPTAKDVPSPSTANWKIVYNFLAELKSNETPDSIYLSLVRSEDAKYAAWILAALTPWSAIPPPIILPGTKIPLPLGTLVVKEGLKADSKLCNVVTGVFRNYITITALKDAIKNGESHIHERDVVGMSIRRWDSQGGNWRLQALFAILVEAMHLESEAGKILSFHMPQTLLISHQGYQSLFSEWQAFLDHLKQLDVMDAPTMKPLVDGTRLSKALGVKPGIWMKAALDVCMEWQLRNPDEKDEEKARELAIEEVRKRKAELKIP